MPELHDYIKVIPNVLDKRFCTGIVNNNNIHYETAGVFKSGEYISDTEVRNCFVANLFEEDDKIVFNSVGVTFRKYVDSIEKEGLSYTVGDITDSGYILLKYNKGGFYKKHCDDHANVHRRLSISFLLNEEYDGGEFQFFGDYKINGGTGSAIIFPSNFCYPHEVLPISSGQRTAIVTWII